MVLIERHTQGQRALGRVDRLLARTIAMRAQVRHFREWMLFIEPLSIAGRTRGSVRDRPATETQALINRDANGQTHLAVNALRDPATTAEHSAPAAHRTLIGDPLDDRPFRKTHEQRCTLRTRIALLLFIGRFCSDRLATPITTTERDARRKQERCSMQRSLP